MNGHHQKEILPRRNGIQSAQGEFGCAAPGDTGEPGFGGSGFDGSEAFP